MNFLLQWTVSRNAELDSRRPREGLTECPYQNSVILDRDEVSNGEESKDGGSTRARVRRFYHFCVEHIRNVFDMGRTDIEMRLEQRAEAGADYHELACPLSRGSQRRFESGRYQPARKERAVLRNDERKREIP